MTKVWQKELILGLSGLLLVFAHAAVAQPSQPQPRKPGGSQVQSKPRPEVKDGTARQEAAAKYEREYRALSKSELDCRLEKLVGYTLGMTSRRDADQGLALTTPGTAEFSALRCGLPGASSSQYLTIDVGERYVANGNIATTHHGLIMFRVDENPDNLDRVVFYLTDKQKDSLKAWIKAQPQPEVPQSPSATSSTGQVAYYIELAVLDSATDARSLQDAASRLGVDARVRMHGSGSDYKYVVTAGPIADLQAAGQALDSVRTIRPNSRLVTRRY